MNLFFRRLWVVLSTLFVSRTAPLNEPYVLKFRVWLTDQDMFMHMTNSRYLSFSDLGRLNLLIRTGLSRQMHKHGWRLEICGQTRTITRMLKAPQTFDMMCEISGWSDRYIAFNHQFKRHEKIHAEINSLMRVTNKAGDLIDVETVLAAIGWTEASAPLNEVFADLVRRSDAIYTSGQLNN